MTVPKKRVDRWSSVSWHQYDAYAELWLRKSSLFDTILDSQPLQRLKQVHFLGAIGLFGTNNRKDSTEYLSRFHHTVGVAYLAARACQALGYDEADTNCVVSAALVHDVGHGALSHSIEPYFKRRFRLCHKHIGRRLIRGDLFLGNELPEILCDFNIGVTDVLSLLMNDASKPGGVLLSGPINVDTIDGLLRAATYFYNDNSARSPIEIMRVLLDPSDDTTGFGDCFWELKNRVYTQNIYSARWAVYDARVTLGLEHCSQLVTEQDFLLGDADFLNRFRFGFE